MPILRGCCGDSQRTRPPVYNARMFATLKRRLDSFVWGDFLSRYGMPGRAGARLLRYVYAVLRDIATGQLTLRSMSLVYTTLLSVVPLLAMSFSVLKGLGAAQELRGRLATFLEPLGTQGEQITEQVMTAVENVNYGVLGSVGLAFFLYTAIALVEKVEESFYYVWFVTESRSFARRFTEYTLVLIFGPLFMILALGLLTSLQNESLVQYLIANNIVGPFLVYLSKLTPYLIITGVFTFLYMFIPNTRVQFRSALIGGVSGGFLWVTASLVFAAFIVGGENRERVYAAFAIAIVTLIWLYLNWLILLIGAQVAFYVQNPAYLRLGRREPRLSCSMRERLALNIMYLVGREFRSPGTGVTVHRLSEALKIPSLTLAPILTGLQNAGLLTCLENENLQPGRDMTRITLNDIMSVVRVQGETGSHRAPQWAPAVAAIGARVDKSVSETLTDHTLSDLVDDLA
jgi:membrane protein